MPVVTRPMSAQQTVTSSLNGPLFMSIYDAITRQTSSTSAQDRNSCVRAGTQGRPAFAQTVGIDATNLDYDARGRLSTITQSSGAAARTLPYAYGADDVVQPVQEKCISPAKQARAHSLPASSPRSQC